MPMAGKFALIIANNEYDDPRLTKLSAPTEPESLADVLRDPAIGEFDDVKVLINQNFNLVLKEIARFFVDRHPEDLLILFYSGHGIRDEAGQLYLAVKDTELRLLSASAIESRFISSQMDGCRSKRQILLLDSSNAGAFVRGTK
jgi:hypothetical protein